MLLFALFTVVSVASAAVVPTNTQDLSCDFESDFCGCTFDLSTLYNWTRSSDTPSYLTGPTGDHTIGIGNGNTAGSFVFIETSWPRIGGDKARLISRELDMSSTGHNCLEFYYHMFGSHVNTLNVYLKSDMDNPIWSLSKEQGDEWKQARVPLSSPAQKDQVVFEGISGSSYRGDIAIDDISSMHDASCSVVPATADPSLPTPVKPPIPPLPDQPNCGQQAAQHISFIVGGGGTKPGEYAWQTMLLYEKSDGSGWVQYCGGSLIYPNWVLTAAHCVVDNFPDEKLRVRLGAHYRDYDRTHGNEQDFDVIEIVNHPEYNFGITFNNDLALLRLNGTALENGTFVRSICLPTSGQQFSADHLCSLSGWGRLQQGGNSPDELQAVDVPIVSYDNCTADASYPEEEISSNMLCAGYAKGGKDTCQGDSGGPLACSDGGVFYIAGVTSWGYGCAMPNHYGVYARVGALLDWIAETVTS